MRKQTEDEETRQQEVKTIIETLIRPKARDHLQARIIAHFASEIEKYYGKYPDRLGDVRSKEAVDASYFGMSRLFQIIGQYRVEYKDLDGPLPQDEPEWDSHPETEEVTPPKTSRRGRVDKTSSRGKSDA